MKLLAYKNCAIFGTLCSTEMPVQCHCIDCTKQTNWRFIWV